MSAGYPVLFIPKKNGKFRLCINYRQLNSIIKQDWYLLPLISKIQDRIRNAQIFIKINLRRVYYQIRIKEGDKWKGVFRTSKGLFKPMVLQFRCRAQLAIVTLPFYLPLDLVIDSVDSVFDLVSKLSLQT